jgi:hypothetical protein
MDDARGVDRVEHIHEPIRDLERLADLELAPAFLPERLERDPLEEVHHQKDAPVVGDAIVEDPDDPRMLHRVGEVSLAKEALADRRVRAQRRVEDLERRPRPVPVGDGINRCHGSGAEEGIDPPLAPDHA